MSARIEVPRVHRDLRGALVLFAVVAAAVVGGLAGAITQVVTDRTPVTTGLARSWDAGKLEAMEGRQLAAQAGTQVGWDAGKLEAMEGRQLAARAGGQVAAQVRTEAATAVAGAFDVMSGRQLAERDTTGASETVVPWDAARVEAMRERQLAGA